MTIDHKLCKVSDLVTISQVRHNQVYNMLKRNSWRGVIRVNNTIYLFCKYARCLLPRLKTRSPFTVSELEQRFDQHFDL